MDIGIIGAGYIGATVGKLWAESGHTVFFGTRHPEQLSGLISEIGPRASAGSAADAAAFGEVVFAAIPYGGWPSLSKAIGPLLAGKVLIDAANAYPERDGTFAEDAIKAGDGAGVPIARLLPGVRYVRAFNTVFWRLLETEAHRDGDRIGIPLAGDDDQAKEIAVRLICDAGFEPVVVGELREARRFDPGTLVYNTGMSGPELKRTLGLVGNS
jgi:8-hydroxy-5-deazaflavin:NADPH oxidoreductase